MPRQSNQLLSLIFFAISLLIFACQKDDVNLQSRCIEGKVLGFYEYCENTVLIQLNSDHAALGKTIEHNGTSYARVIKVAGGNIDHPGELQADRTVYLRLREYHADTDSDLIISPRPCPAYGAPMYQHVPIYVSTAVSFDGCL